MSIPTHRDMIRADENDFIFKTKDAKYNAVVEEIADAHERGQPVLVGTISVEISEMLAERLTTRGVSHKVLNAKHHEQEAQIIIDAGQPGAVTIATKHGRNAVSTSSSARVSRSSAGYVIGTERHESRRIDNQLRGRSGRQGDAGHAVLPLGPRTTWCASSRVTHRSRSSTTRPRATTLADRGQMLTRTVQGAEGRGAELRHPQAGARVRRCAEQAA